MEHSAAINQVLVGLLFGILIYFSGCTWYMVRRILKRNDDDHEKFTRAINHHTARLIRLETRIRAQRQDN